MEIQFTLANQSLQNLIQHYIGNSNTSQKTVLLNSILMSIVQLPQQQSLHKVYNLGLQIRQNNAVTSVQNKQYTKKLYELIRELIKKYTNSLNKAQLSKLQQIVRDILGNVFCAVVGNQAISLLYQLINQIKDKANKSQIVIIIQKHLLLDTRMICASYRQITRYQLYTLIRQVINQKQAKMQDKEYVLKILKLVEDQKDPRNILTVFQIYWLILQNSSIQVIETHKQMIFDGLQIYYPIDFQGDTQRYNIDLKMIAYHLQKCLAHPQFMDQTYKLLLQKMGAPPISKHINLLTLWIRNNKLQNQHYKFLSNLLLRTVEQQYLLEDYSQSQSTLPQLIVELINQLLRNKNHECLSLPIYDILIKWLHNLTEIVNNNEHNSKYAGVVIQIFQMIGNKITASLLLALISQYVIIQFIKNAKKKDQVGESIYKLGILVPILEGTNYLQHGYIFKDMEKIGLLIMGLSHIFHKTDQEQQQPKLLILKIFMLISSLPNKHFRRTVQQTNIMHYCIQFLKEKSSSLKSNSTIIIKSYVDFLVETYGQVHQQSIHQCLSQITDKNAKIYGLITLLLKNKESQKMHKLGFYKQILSKQYRQQLVKVLKAIKLEGCIQFLFGINSDLTAQLDMDLIANFELVIREKNKNIKEQEQLHNIQNTIFQKFNTEYIVPLYILRSFWRSAINDSQLLQPIQKLFQNFSSSIKQAPLVYQLFIRLLAFYRSALQCFKTTNKLQLSQQFLKQPAYISQRCCLLPIDLQIHTPSNKLLIQIIQKFPHKLAPTIKTHLWYISSSLSTQQSQQLQTLLIPYLPSYFLKKYGKNILNKITNKDNGIQCLSKGMIESLDIQSIIQNVLPYVKILLQKFTCQTTVNYIVALNKVLLDLKKRCQTDIDAKNMDINEENKKEYLKTELIKIKGNILISIQQKFLQHRKRQGRQSSRHIFAVYNLLK